MNALPKIDMIEATRLTREGRLGEAMAVLRRALSSGPLSAASSESDGGARRSPAEAAPHFLDMVPPSVGTGDSWTSPQFGETHPAGRPGSMSQGQIPEALRGFLDRMGHFPAARGPDGPPRPAAERAPDRLPDGALFEEHTYAKLG